MNDIPKCCATCRFATVSGNRILCSVYSGQNARIHCGDDAHGGCQNWKRSYTDDYRKYY